MHDESGASSFARHLSLLKDNGLNKRAARLCVAESPGPRSNWPHQRQPFTLLASYTDRSRADGKHLDGLLRGPVACPALSLKGRQGSRTNYWVLADFHVAV